MTAYENVELGLHSTPRYSILEAFVRTRHARNIESQTRHRAHELLEMVDLEEHANKRASSLPYGLQRRLEMARAMAAGPDLLLLDEPAAGMNEDECEDLIQLIRRIHAEKKYTMIMIEHHMKVVMDLCAGSRIYVLNLGSFLAMGSPEEIQTNPDVVRAYLGERKSDATRPILERGNMVTNTPMLEVTDLVVHYGGICALDRVNLHVDQGEIVAVIGANGAGKSTLMRTICAVKPFTSGTIMFKGQPLKKEASQVVARRDDAGSRRSAHLRAAQRP